MFKKFSIQFVQRLFVGLMAVLLFMGAGTSMAWAMPFNHSTYIAFENQLEGYGDRAQGKVNEALGRAERKYGDDLGDRTKGAIREGQGKAEQAFGKAKVYTDRTGDRLENRLDDAGDNAENFFDRVKDFFD